MKILLPVLAFILFVQVGFAQSDLESAVESLNKAQGYQWLAEIQQNQAAYYLGKSPNLSAKINLIINKINLKLRKTPKSAPFLMARGYAYYAIAEFFNHKSAFGTNKLNDVKIKSNLVLASKDIEKTMKLDKSLADYFSIRGKIRVFQCNVKVFTSDKDCYQTPLTDFTYAIYSSPDSYYFYDDRISLNESFGKTDLVKADEDFKAIYEPLTLKKIEAEEKLQANQTPENYYEAAKINFEIFLKMASFHDDNDSVNDQDVIYNHILIREYFLTVSQNQINESLKLSKTADYFAFRGKTNLYFGSVYDDEKGRETAVKYFESAIKDYTEAIKLNPKNTGYYIERSVTYKNLGKTDLQNADIETAKKLKSNP